MSIMEVTVYSATILLVFAQLFLSHFLNVLTKMMCTLGGEWYSRAGRLQICLLFAEKHLIVPGYYKLCNINYLVIAVKRN